MFLDLHQVLVYLNQSLSFCSICWSNYNLIDKQSCIDLLDQMLLFEYYHIFFNYFQLTDQKLLSNNSVLSMDHKIIICYFYSWKIRLWCNVLSVSHSNDKIGSIFTPWKLGSISNFKMDLALMLLVFLDICPTELFF